MRSRQPSSPRWYRDPVDPVQLRHWNGRSWDPRPRTVPAWAVGSHDFVIARVERQDGQPTLEGPARPAGLPATATATVTAFGPTARPGTPGRSIRVGEGGHGGATVAGWSAGTRPIRRASVSRPRAAFMVLSALVGVVVLVLAATIGVSPQPPGVTDVAQDVSFIRAANVACGEAIGAARLISPADGGVLTPAGVADANADLSRLATTISALPVVVAARSSVEGWLDNWHQFAADRQREAQQAAGDPSASDGTLSWASTVSLDADRADAFATTNGLDDCTLSVATSPLTAS